MTRLSDPDPATLPSEVGQLLGALPDLGLFRLLSHSNSVLPAWLTMGGTLLSSLTITPALRELVILQVAATTQCRYEETQHVEIARGVGVPEEQINAVVSHRLDEPCLERAAGILRTIDRLIREHTLTKAEFDVLRAQLNERQVVELLVVVGWYLAIALMIGAVDLPADPAANMAVVDAASAHLGGDS